LHPLQAPLSIDVPETRTRHTGMDGRNESGHDDSGIAYFSKPIIVPTTAHETSYTRHARAGGHP